jgi:hypothetical protein
MMLHSLVAFWTIKTRAKPMAQFGSHIRAGGDGSRNAICERILQSHESGWPGASGFRFASSEEKGASSKSREAHFERQLKQKNRKKRRAKATTQLARQQRTACHDYFSRTQPRLR